MAFFTSQTYFEDNRTTTKSLLNLQNTSSLNINWDYARNWPSIIIKSSSFLVTCHLIPYNFKPYTFNPYNFNHLQFEQITISTRENFIRLLFRCQDISSHSISTFTLSTPATWTNCNFNPSQFQSHTVLTHYNFNPL